MAVLLLAAGAGNAAAEQLTDRTSARLVDAPVASLLTADELAAGGLGQWGYPIWPGVAGGPYGGFALPQTAAFFGYTNQMNPIYQAGLGGNTGITAPGTLSAFNALSGFNQTGLAPGTALSLNSLVGLGLGSTVGTPNGGTLFNFGGGTALIPPGLTAGTATLGSFPGAPNAFIGATGLTGFNPFLAQLGFQFAR